MNKILFGDCRDTLPTIDVKARMCVTSPPYYGLRNYGNEDNQIGQEETPEQFIENLVSVFRSVRDVLTDDGTLWVNIGDSYYNYRPGKGQSYPKQSVSKTKQDLPDKCNKRGNKLEGLNVKDSQEFWKKYKRMFCAKEDQFIGNLICPVTDALMQSDKEKEELLFKTFFQGEHLKNKNFDEDHFAEVEERVL